MRILFAEQKLRTDKLGPMYLSAVLKEHGHKVRLVQDGVESVERAVMVWKPDFVAFSISSDAHRWFTNMNRILKSKFKFTCVVGGPHFTFFPEHGKEDPDVDFVVQGPGEQAILDVVEGRATEKLVIGHIAEDVNTIPKPDRSVLYRYPEFGRARIKRFMAGRDCPNACIYCYNHVYHRLYASEKKRFFQLTSVRNMVDEIAEVRNQWGLEFVIFNDDDLARDSKWLHEFLSVYSREINLPFYALVRAENATQDILNHMSEASCFSIGLALESSVASTMKLLRRGAIRSGDVVRCIDDCKRLGIRTRLLNMIGIPVDNPLEDALATMEFNIQVNPTHSRASIFWPCPKTDAWKLCTSKGLIGPKTSNAMSYDQCGLLIPDAMRLTRLAQWWTSIAMGRIPTEVVRILIDSPISESQARQLHDINHRESARMFSC